MLNIYTDSVYVAVVKMLFFLTHPSGIPNSLMVSYSWGVALFCNWHQNCKNVLRSAHFVALEAQINIQKIKQHLDYPSIQNRITEERDSWCVLIRINRSISLRHTLIFRSCIYPFSSSGRGASHGIWIQRPNKCRAMIVCHSNTLLFAQESSLVHEKEWFYRSNPHYSELN